MIHWADAAASLERLLEHAALLIDGESDLGPVPTIDLEAFNLSSNPDVATLDHVRALLAQVPDAVEGLERAKAAIGADLDELAKHRTAATAYVRAPVSR